MDDLRSKPSNLVQTIERVSLILDILGNSPHGISVGELSEKTGFPKGTTHRLLTSSAYFDLVRQDPTTKKYHLGFKLVERSRGGRSGGMSELTDKAKIFISFYDNLEKKITTLTQKKFNNAYKKLLNKL